MGDNSMVEAISIDCIMVEIVLNGHLQKICIKDVLNVPRLHANLLLVRKMVSHGLNVQFNHNSCILKATNGEMIVMVPQ